ncbi:MAG: CBS domain-containing protein [Chloroflexi bacterium]|nr:CBS domain-containing protein [Chloroflexota bacterium]
MTHLVPQQTAQRMRIYIGESDRWQGKPLYAALLETLKTGGVAGATVTRGVAGFGAHSHIHTAAVLRLSEDLPIVIDVVETPEKIQATLAEIAPMVREGLITLEEVRVVKYTHRYLNPLPADRPVEAVMTPAVKTLPAEMPVAVAWQNMLSSKIKSFPVVDAQGELVGILTDEDLLSRAGLQHRLAVALQMDTRLVREDLRQLEGLALRVEDVMSRPVVTAALDETLGTAAGRMIQKGLKRLPVVDAHRRPVGMLSRLDVLRQVTSGAIEPPPAALLPEDVQTARDIMLAEIPQVREDDRLAEVVSQLVTSGAHKLVVLDQAGRPVGLVSDSDVVARIHASQQKGVLQALRRLGQPPAAGLAARDLMSAGVLTVSPHTPVVQLANQMLAEGRKWVVVVDEEGQALGLVDRGVLLAALVR